MASDDEFIQKLGLEISQMNENEIELSAKSFRIQSIASVLGAGNDGISHLVAALDVSWESLPTNTSLKERIKKSARLLRPYMEGVPSWKIQLLDLLLMLNINPYQLPENQDTLTLSQSTELMIATANEINSKFIQRNGNVLNQYPQILERFLLTIQEQEEIKKSAVLLCELLLSLVKNDYVAFIQLTVNATYDDVFQHLVKVFAAFPAVAKATNPLIKTVLSNDKATFKKLFTYVQVPAKLDAALKEKNSDSVKRSPKCMLLNTESGYSDWIQALISTTDSFTSFFSQDLEKN